MAGKSPDQLNLRPEPLHDPDPRGTPWYRFAREIDDLLATGRYTWAEFTLAGIQETVERNQQVTEGQRTAVANIEAGVYKSHGRRYENYSRRFR